MNPYELRDELFIQTPTPIPMRVGAILRYRRKAVTSLFADGSRNTV